MKLDLQTILQSATTLYREKKAEKGFPSQYTENLEIVSDQIKALAEALVEAINLAYSADLNP